MSVLSFKGEMNAAASTATPPVLQNAYQRHRSAIRGPVAAFADGQWPVRSLRRDVWRRSRQPPRARGPPETLVDDAGPTALLVSVVHHALHLGARLRRPQIVDRRGPVAVNNGRRPTPRRGRRASGVSVSFDEGEPDQGGSARGSG